ncbi:hypothetical protein I4U23_005530 [Adineta vaga]|nr:hypothetical protein I4U23_005530 [Adineta vaga]
MSCSYLRRYYCIRGLEEKCTSNFSTLSRVTYIDTKHELAGEVYLELGELYRQEAQRVLATNNDRIEAKRLLAKSKHSYQLLEQSTEKTLEHYASILRKQGMECKNGSSSNQSKEDCN